MCSELVTEPCKASKPRMHTQANKKCASRLPAQGSRHRTRRRPHRLALLREGREEDQVWTFFICHLWPWLKSYTSPVHHEGRPDSTEAVTAQAAFYSVAGPVTESPLSCEVLDEQAPFTQPPTERASDKLGNLSSNFLEGSMAELTTVQRRLLL